MKKKNILSCLLIEKKSVSFNLFGFIAIVAFLVKHMLPNQI